MFKFDIGDEVKITCLLEYEPNVYKIGKAMKVRKRAYKEGFDYEPIYWFGDKRYLSHTGIYQSQLEKV